MRVDDFDFELPKHLIADHPVEPRDASRLLLVGARVEDRRIAELPQLLRPGDLMVCNDTRVIPARLVGARGAARIEATLHRDMGGGAWRAFIKGAKRVKPGDRIDFAEDFSAEVAAKHEEGDATLRFDREGAEFHAALERHGSMPLPPYIKRPAGGEARDRGDYQTIFAARDGAVAAPTAGLHFTEALLASLDAAEIARLTVTLHVGAGTFLPVKVDETRDHKMHSEQGFISADAAQRINATRAQGGRIVAIGTTALRLLESAADEEGR